MIIGTLGFIELVKTYQVTDTRWTKESDHKELIWLYHILVHVFLRWLRYGFWSCVWVFTPVWAYEEWAHAKLGPFSSI